MIHSALYEKVVALNPDAHCNLRFDATQVSFGFAHHCTFVHVAYVEFARAAPEYPIAFIRGDDQQLRPVVLLGVREGENLFVNAAGLWDAAYIPVLVQHYPFVMAEDPQTDRLCIDEKCPALNFEKGELLIDAKGVLQQRVNDELQFFHDFQQETAQTELMVKQLDELGLFVPLGAQVDKGGAFQLNDVYSIDEAKLELIADAILPGLFHSGALKLAYLHMASLDNMRRLLSRAESRSAEKQLSAIKKPLAQETRIPRKLDQGMQKPILRSKLNDDHQPFIAGQQEKQRKHDLVTKLADEANRLAQQHKERYAQGRAELAVAESEIPAAPVETKNGKRGMPAWTWWLVVLAGAAIIFGVSGVKRDSLTVTAPAPTVSAPKLASEADPFAGAMVPVSPGKFEMGSTNGDADEKPVQQVNISHAFEIGRTEVTQGQWKSMMGRLPEKLYFKNCGDNCPVENVSWNDAQAFIIKLNAKSGKQYRLPSEAEWEYACRAGGTHNYCGGNNPDVVAWYGNDRIGKTPHPVASKEPNAWGLYDMSGNVWEWVEDCYHDRYRGAHSDTSCDARVLRGGSWSNEADTPRSANRYKRAADERFNNNGFRLARGLP